MTLEEINNVEDKAERLRLLREYVERAASDQRDEDEITADADMNATRDETGGMMSRHGKPRQN